VVKINYTSCSSDFSSATFDPDYTDLSGLDCDTIAPLVNYESGTAASGTQNYDSIYVNVSASDVGRGDNNVSTFINFNNSLVSWWRMDDLNATGGLVDYMGINNGSVVGDAGQIASGAMGKAFNFDELIISM
jgi:hypothetical protein